MDKYLNSSQKLSIEKKLNQALRLNEPELRDFERKLRDSYISKEQMCQIKEHEHKQTLEKVRSVFYCEYYYRYDQIRYVLDNEST